MSWSHVGAAAGIVAGLAFVAMANDERGRARIRQLDQAARDWIAGRWRDFRWRNDPPGKHAAGGKRSTRRAARRLRDDGHQG